jgi:hypothetical protein
MDPKILDKQAADLKLQAGQIKHEKDQERREEKGCQKVQASTKDRKWKQNFLLAIKA